MNQHTELTGRIELLDSFWEAPADIEKGYASFAAFYRWNYLKRLTGRKDASVLVVSCGPGYFINVLSQEGYTNVLGIDSDPEKIAHATQRGLNCRAHRAFPFLQESKDQYDLIFCEQELNHLTKEEIVTFLHLCMDALRDGGKLIVHSLNGANPITGAEALAQNFNHYNSFTAYSLRQVLEHCGYRDVHVFPLHLYVFRKNPLNYIAWAAAGILHFAFRAAFVLYGKSNKLWTKKIAATGIKRARSA
jgi:SAM-dependent methyltransferase